MINRLVILLSLLVASPLLALDSAERSPVNQVFQFMYSGQCAEWSDGVTTKSTAYLWVPDNCAKLRGIMILCPNVPEHMLAGHPTIRKMCEENSLGIVWCAPSFWRFANAANGHDNTQVDFLKSLLAGLAEVSGYTEVASVPWVPIGESGHLLMVCGCVEQNPANVLAGLCVKNGGWPKTNRTVPMLWTFGSAQEWGQMKGDIRTGWNIFNGNPISCAPANWAKHASAEKWPLSSAIEAGSGHFYCTEQMIDLIATYIQGACNARLDSEGGLKPVAYEMGFYAALPFDGSENLSIDRVDSAEGKANPKRPWFFDEATAKAAQTVTRANWEARTQLPGCTEGTNCTVQPYSLNSVTTIKVTTDSEFSLKTVMLEKIPEGFVGTGEPLATTPGVPVAEWICGPFAPLGNNTFRIALDRTYRNYGAAYMILRKDAAGDVRLGIQPIGVNLLENTSGQDQRITFEKIPDVKSGTHSVALSAKADSGLPVEFFVVAGPAIVKDGQLVFTKIPPRAKFPVSVTVAAWQWGRATEPKIKTAEIVKQTFQIL